jgi:hypothetical protein
VLNEILWRSIKGERAAPPPVVRSGWIRHAGAPADGDQDR